MTINEAIYSALDGLNISTDDFPVRKRFVYQQTKDARAELIKQELNKKRLLVLDNTLQAIDCFKLEKIDASFCFDCPTGEYVLQSVKELPEAVEYASGMAIYPYFMNGVRLDPINKETYMTRHRRRYKLAGSSGFMIRNRRLIVVGYDDIEELNITVDGHFANPEDIISLNNEDNENCDTKCQPVFDMPFACPAHLERRVIEIARQVCLRKLSIPSDNSNNSQFDPNVTSKEEPNS